MQYIMLPVILFFSSRTNGTTGPGDSRSQSLGGAGVMLADEAAVMPNQASLAMLRKACVSLYAEDHFYVPELASGSVSLCLPAKTGTFDLSYNNYGFSAYQENRTGLAFGKALGEGFRAGIEMTYWAIRQSADYGNLHAFIPSLGIQAIPMRQLTLGFQISNPAGQGFYPKRYRKIPTTINVGLGYFAGDEILICFEYKKESFCKPVYCGGVEYNKGNLLNFRLGLSSSPLMQYSFGVGFRKDHLRMYISVCHHPVLGYSPSITLTCTL
jgi:hypothetical protein